MIHETDCPNTPERWDAEASILWPAVCHCQTARAAYQRGREGAARDIEELGCNEHCGCSITIPNAAAAARGAGTE